MLMRHPAQGPERVLQVLSQSREALTAEHDSGMFPAAVGQHKVIEAVWQGHSGDGDPKRACIGEVGQRHTPGLLRLAEDHVTLGTMQGAPVAHAPFQCPPDAVIGKAVWVSHLQMP